MLFDLVASNLEIEKKIGNVFLCAWWWHLKFDVGNLNAAYGQWIGLLNLKESRERHVQNQWVQLAGLKYS